MSVPSEAPTAVRAYAANTSGRDYVVGDIHGCFRQLQRRLYELRFDPQRDRLFSVGDLIDRGPWSFVAAHWLQQPWFHACVGNHEAMLLSLANDWRQRPEWFYYNGGDWWFDLSEVKRQQLLALLRRLPYAMEVATPWGRVGIVHADVSPKLSWGAFRQALLRGDEQARATAIWSRTRADGKVRHGVKGIDRVVCGHTIHPQHVAVRENVWFIDTGSFLDPDGDTLTVLALQDLFLADRGARQAG